MAENSAYYHENLENTPLSFHIPHSESEPPLIAPPIKKKRKQLVACDACRVRRVKCNKSEQRANGSCTECIKKAINCTDSYIKSKPKVVRNGKLIEKAKLLYGAGNATESQELSSVDGDFSHLRRPSSSASGKQVIRAAEGRLFVEFLAYSIAGDLIDTYIELIHPQCPIIDISHFKKAFDAAGRDTSKMSSSGEALALVLQALAARFSDNTAIIGDSAPKISDLRVSSGEDFSDFGIRREGFCRSMAERALQKIDENGTLRRASAASAGALLMLEFLLTWDDSYRATGRHLITAAVEHLRSLSDGVTDDPTEDKVDQVGTLFWMCYTRDAISSAFGSRSTSLSDNDLVILCELLSNPMTDQIMTFVSSDDPRNLCGLAVICSFKLITEGFRRFTTHVSGPIPRRSPLNETAVRELWSVISASRKFSSIYYASVQRAIWSSPPKSDPWFRDLTSMRVQLSFVIHRNICDRLSAELECNRPRDLSYQNYVDMLRALKSESDNRLLLSIRDLGLYMHNYGVNLIFLSALSCENMPLYLDHMISGPVVYEQGGNEDWTLNNKIEELTWFIDALKQMSWAWNYKRSINEASLALAHLNIQAQHAAAARSFTQSPPPATYGMLPHPSNSQSIQYPTISHLDPAALHQGINPSSRSAPAYRNESSSSTVFNSNAASSTSTFTTPDNSFYPSQIPNDHDGFSQAYPEQILPPVSYPYEDFIPRPLTSSNYPASNPFLYSNPDNFPSSSAIPLSSSSLPIPQYPIRPTSDISGAQYSYDHSKYNEESFGSNPANQAYRRDS